MSQSFLSQIMGDLYDNKLFKNGGNGMGGYPNLVKV